MPGSTGNLLGLLDRKSLTVSIPAVVKGLAGRAKSESEALSS